MQTWIALFLGINVGGNNKLPMKDLKLAMEAAKLNKVRTYIQSGNVIFETTAKSPKRLSTKLGKIVFDNFGFEPAVMVLSGAHLSQAVDSNPFPESKSDPKTLHLFFLDSEPGDYAPEKFQEVALPSEQFKLLGDVFYLYTPDGMARSKLGAKAEKLLGVSATARNLRTATKILELIDG